MDDVRVARMAKMPCNDSKESGYSPRSAEEFLKIPNPSAQCPGSMPPENKGGCSSRGDTKDPRRLNIDIPADPFASFHVAITDPKIPEISSEHSHSLTENFDRSNQFPAKRKIPAYCRRLPGLLGHPAFELGLNFSVIFTK